jgi:hypothetical protein
MNAFEILVNGTPVCVAGANPVFHAGLSWSRFRDKDGGFGFDVGGSNDDEQWEHGVVWPVPAIGIGDEVTIRLISTDSVDAAVPRVSSPYPKPPTPPGARRESHGKAPAPGLKKTGNFRQEKSRAFC